MSCFGQKHPRLIQLIHPRCSAKTPAIRAHTQEPCPNDQILQILSAPFASEGNCGKGRRLLFFLLASSLIAEMPISGGSAKRQWCLFFGAYRVVFFSLKKYFCSTEDFRAVTFS
jgi:hypothetical protein